MYISGQLPARRKLYKHLLRAYNESLYCLHLRECFMGPIASLLVFFGAALLLMPNAIMLNVEKFFKDAMISRFRSDEISVCSDIFGILERDTKN